MVGVQKQRVVQVKTAAGQEILTMFRPVLRVMTQYGPVSFMEK
jgi:hypothetical protein